MEHSDPLKGWHEGTRSLIDETFRDQILSALLRRSNLTKVQFETLLVDQLGHEMANKPLTRSDMLQLRRDQKGISRGSFNRTLRQARENVVEAIHTVLLLGYCGLTESPSIAPFLEASERLKGQTSQLRDAAQNEPGAYQRTVDSIIDDLEQAFRALFGRNRDT
jgi:PAS domain-containing protein